MTTPAKEEASKKNTDCVYFLASPLTCKKGDECEFRHSESARINPRDCRYWLVGSCLNVHCPFRHPPLEGIPEGDAAAFSASVLGRSRVPCYYFSQGYCAKGDKCAFMHAPTAVELSQRQPKPNPVRTIDNQVSTIKANNTFMSNTAPWANETPSDVSLAGDYTAKLRQTDQNAKMADNASRLSGESDSLTLRKTQTYPDDLVSNRSRKSYATNDDLYEAKIEDSNFLHLQEIQAEDDALCEAQATDVSTHEDHVEEDRAKNGTESEELWEESSFDVLVDDGTDHLIYAENMEFISSCDVMLDGHIRAGLLNVEEFGNYDYEHGDSYDQYYDGTEYDLATYEAYKQQLDYGRFNSYEYRDGIQQEIMPGGNNPNEAVVKERHGVSIHAKGGCGSFDLRNQIVKRRRAERSHRLEEDVYQWQRRNGLQHGQAHQGGKMRHNVFQERDHTLPDSKSKLIRKVQGRGEAPRTRPILGRLGEFLGKRPYDNMVVDHEVIDPDNASIKSSDHLKPKFRKGRSEPANIPGSRVPVVKNDNVSFQGPKTLAQIKAEKMKSSNDRRTGQKNVDSYMEDEKKGKQFPKHENKQNRNLSPIQNNRESMTENAKGSDFEGPKPLSVILKEKRKELKDIRTLGHKAVHLDSHLYISGAQSATGSMMDPRDDSDLLTLSNGCQQTAIMLDRDRRGIDVSELDEQDDKSNFDLDNRAYIGDTTTDDVEFDDEDEDFAKKLGHFFF